MSEYGEGRGLQPVGHAIVKVSYSHDAIIDCIIAHPEFTQNELCQKFDYTPGWMSRVIGSDAFQNRLAERRGELVDPVVTQGLKDRLQAISVRSTDVILEAMDGPKPPVAVALKALEISARAQSYGARVRTPPVLVQVNQNVNGTPAPKPAENKFAGVTVDAEFPPVETK